MFNARTTSLHLTQNSARPGPDSTLRSLLPLSLLPHSSLSPPSAQITTVCVFGTFDPELLCHAHAHGARVTFGSSGPPVAEWTDPAAVDRWVATTVAKAVNLSADGFNIDIEQYLPPNVSAAVPAALTALAGKAATAMHAARPGSHVTFDVPSEGKAQDGGCGNQYGRRYDYHGLAAALDFLVVMDYDSNDPNAAGSTGPQLYLPRHAPDYVFTTREAAAAACAAEPGAPPLCTVAELAGYDHCAGGWLADGEGYWMAEAKAGCGHPGFNNFSGPAGAYCCWRRPQPPCPTCFYANAALPVVEAGVRCFGALGVPPAKLVLAFPWYGYDYECDAQPPSGYAGPCLVRTARQINYPAAAALLASHAVAPGRIWLANSSTPAFYYRPNATAPVHRVDFDDSESLRLKYGLARRLGARGVGMWHASALDYAGKPAQAAQFWADLEVFEGSSLERLEHS